MYYSCYCDGAIKNNGRKNPDSPVFGGIGIVFINQKREIIKEVSMGFSEEGKYKHITNNVMELAALINSLKIFVSKIRDYNANYDVIDVYSDSEYVVKGWNERLYKWIRNGWCINSGDEVSNKDMWKELLSISKSSKCPTFRVYHVKGHDKNEFNNIADELAVKGKESIIKQWEIKNKK